MAAKAGCTAFRKLIKRYPGYSLVPCGRSHMQFVDPNGNVVRHPNGIPFTMSNSPRNPERAVREIIRDLRALGVEGRTS